MIKTGLWPSGMMNRFVYNDGWHDLYSMSALIFKQATDDMFRADDASSSRQQGADSAMKKLLCNVLVVLFWPSAAFASDTPGGYGGAGLLEATAGHSKLSRR